MAFLGSIWRIHPLNKRCRKIRAQARFPGDGEHALGAAVGNHRADDLDLAALREKDLYPYRSKFQMVFLVERSVKNSS